ncbi:MAG: hypothetical protein JWM68_784 [Verrucomicrobiales bacterium]|nr:hypothetical protein [Verrucomicrobiales bacterium]
MPSNRTIISLAWCAFMFAFSTDAAVDRQTEDFVEQMPRISEIGYGYSAMFSGSQFLPEPDASEVHTMVLGSQSPKNSAILERIVRRGILAVPSLLKHLDDARETKIPPISSMEWTSWADEYDYNHRTTKDIPTGVNKDAIGWNETHTITVGDLCFVALGQIVNRNFSATRYQPTGGLIVSSPTYSKRLCEVVRAKFEGLTERKHRELLIQDFVMPDSEGRRNGASTRLAFYYPEVLERLVLKQLAMPTYDVFKVNDFVRDELYRNNSPDKRRMMFNEFIRTNHPTFSDGILIQLFEDLSLQEADEQGHLSPPLNGKYNARTLLIQFYHYPNVVNSTNKPYVDSWTGGELARFIRALGHHKSGKIDKAVHGIFTKIVDDDYLAIPCMERLIGKGYDEEIRRYCQRRIPQSKYEATELRDVLKKLETKDTK